MVKRSVVFQNLPSDYLFPKMNQKKLAFLEKHPTSSLISLGVGDTVEPLPSYVASEMEKMAASLGTREGYTGYGEGQGSGVLREQICNRFYRHKIKNDEVFISDGAKCDIGRLQMFFGGNISVAIQDPSYPVYLEGSIFQGIGKIHLMPCLPENGFFPDLSKLPPCDLLYICHPNNPTGTAYSYEQLQVLVNYALEHQIIILFDVAYSAFIRDPNVPKSIYDIKDGEKVAIEVGSFSKMAGFSGIRLGWTVVPKALHFEEGHEVWKDWKRMMMTIYNGPSKIAERGGIAALEDEGWNEIEKILNRYLENAKKLKEKFEGLGHKVYGGENAPYLWVHYPGRASWDIFQTFLEERHLIVTPGVGFGFSGEHFIRISAFAREEEIGKALHALQSS